MSDALPKTIPPLLDRHGSAFNPIIESGMTSPGPVVEPRSGLGQNEKGSEWANVVRFTSETGHRICDVNECTQQLPRAGGELQFRNQAGGDVQECLMITPAG